MFIEKLKRIIYVGMFANDIIMYKFINSNFRFTY